MKGDWYLIVGVVGSVKQLALDGTPRIQVYVPQKQFALSSMTVTLRTSGDPSLLAGAVRAQVRALDPELPVYAVRTMRDVVDLSMAQPRFRTRLLALFAALALILATVGIYGVVAYTVTERHHEIGLRMALGARRLDVVRLVVGQGLKLAVGGVALGVVAALALSQVLSGLLFGVSATDLATFVAVSLLLVGVTLLATYLPARRAARVDPMVALRYE